ncbi:MAG TPA: MraY family glycosyltransferase, partial [Flavobacteriales bacterium]|nr:MraY family glycosyltransferase [Flavobacteriales bacterium]
KKLLAHIVVAFILVLMGETQIKSMHGIFGIYEIPEWARIFLSVFVYIVIVNAFNLIDGVDGLAAGIGVICSVFFGVWFITVSNDTMALLSFILAGSLLGFLLFNFSPARIFMGDSGSLTIGCII